MSTSPLSAAEAVRGPRCGEWPSDVFSAGRDAAGLYGTSARTGASGSLEPGAGTPGAAGNGSAEVTAPDEDLLDAPETLRHPAALYGGSRGRAYLLGAAVVTNSPLTPLRRSSLTRSATRSGTGWRRRSPPARDRGADISDSEALTAFLADVRDGPPSLDEDLLGRVLKRQLGRSAPGAEGVSRPASCEPAAPWEELGCGGRTCQGCRSAPRLRGLAWPWGSGAHVGREPPPPPRELMALLGTGDEGREEIPQRCRVFRAWT